MLYAKVGSRFDAEFTASREYTLQFQRLVAEHAFREIYARGEYPRVAWFRTPHVDAEAYARERAAFVKWHDTQAEAERSLSA